ncbi:10745_t:CDS:2 [Acaulospora colombiana]|uniref:10745_t:CDS:1 n=1 Tax=Acaulospora colombiana TaxID=27376 RepID=A0ACA9NIV3_9GLOM|nr:10745_t:CDS:2 [Acaulospora colombiana]
MLTLPNEILDIIIRLLVGEPILNPPTYLQLIKSNNDIRALRLDHLGKAVDIRDNQPHGMTELRNNSRALTRTTVVAPPSAISRFHDNRDGTSSREGQQEALRQSGHKNLKSKLDAGTSKEKTFSPLPLDGSVKLLGTNDGRSSLVYILSFFTEHFHNGDSRPLASETFKSHMALFSEDKTAEPPVSNDDNGRTIDY